MPCFPGREAVPLTRSDTGLENAGKTSLLHRLSSGEFVIFTPTERAHAEQFDLGGISFRAYVGAAQLRDLVADVWGVGMCRADGTLVGTNRSGTCGRNILPEPTRVR